MCNQESILMKRKKHQTEEGDDDSLSSSVISNDLPPHMIASTKRTSGRGMEQTILHVEADP